MMNRKFQIESKPFAIASIVILLSTLTLSCIFTQKTFISEIKIGFGIYLTLTFFVTFILLYNGFTLQKNELILKKPTLDSLDIQLPAMDLGEEIGIIFKFLSWIVLGLFFIALYLFLFNFVDFLIPAIIVFANWLTYKLLKRIRITSRFTNGRFFKSLMYSIGYILAYGVWFLIVLEIARKIGT